MSPRTTIRNDERGAVMVLGIVMCTCLVGALWYIAGIGDAIVYRERLQEAADATAFSGAVLHARGMNFIVLINLVMALVLAIRVALKVIQIALGIATVLFAALAFFFPPFGAAAELCGQGVKVIQDVINITRTPINNALKVLSKVEIGVGHAVPFASLTGSYQVADKYQPAVATGFSGTSADRYAKGLPIEEGTTDRLCGEAGRAVGEGIGWVLPDKLKFGGKVGDKFNSLMGKIAKKGSGWFCELGGAGGPPDMSDLLDEGADEACKERKKELDKKLADKNDAWHRECDRLGITCLDEDPFTQQESQMGSTTKLGAQDQASLERLHGDRDAASDAVRSFDGKKCRADEKDKMKKQLQLPASQATNGKGMTPKKVEAKWSNGRKDTQMIAWVNGNDRLLKISPGGVKIAGMSNPKAGQIEKPDGADFAFAQAEFFYDCSGAWRDADCNGRGNDQEEAMWHFRWRARLRRYNTPYNDLPRILELAELLPAQWEFQSRATAAAARLSALGSPRSLALKTELGQIIVSVPPDPKTYAIH